VAGDDSGRARDVAGVEVTREHVAHPGQPFRREAAAGHSLPFIILSIFAEASAECRFTCGKKTFRARGKGSWDPRCR
jgi:hypothetical protein